MDKSCTMFIKWATTSHYIQYLTQIHSLTKVLQHVNGLTTLSAVCRYNSMFHIKTKQMILALVYKLSDRGCTFFFSSKIISFHINLWIDCPTCITLSKTENRQYKILYANIIWKLLNASAKLNSMTDWDTLNLQSEISHTSTSNIIIHSTIT